MVPWDPHRPSGVLATEDLCNHSSVIVSYLCSLFLCNFIYLLSVAYILKCNLSAAAAQCWKRPWPEPCGRSAPNEHHQGRGRSSCTWKGFEHCAGKETPPLTPVPLPTDLPGSSPELRSKLSHRAFSISSLPRPGPVLSWRRTKAPEPGRAVPQPGSSPCFFPWGPYVNTKACTCFLYFETLIFLQVRWTSSQEAEEGSPFCSHLFPILYIHVSGGSFGGYVHSRVEVKKGDGNWKKNGWLNTK